MIYSRRDFIFAASGLTVGGADVSSGSLASKTYPFEGLPVRQNGANSMRPVLEGQTHAGVAVELHITELAPGGAPHPPHHHVHEEMLLVREGTLEVTIAGRVSTLNAGSVAFVATNEEHGWRNVGNARAQYFVLALGRDA